jgi:hypothetical protein
MGGPDEQLQGSGGGNYSERAGVQLTVETPLLGEQISLFPSEAEQIQSIVEAESVQTPFAFSVSDEDFAHVLRLGGNTDENRMKVVTEFSKQKPADELAAFLQKSYHGGNGFTLSSGRVSVWYAEDGIHLAQGDAARNIRSAQVISWTDAAERIRAMLDDGSFATNVELAEAPGYERRQIAQALLYLHHDLSEDARDAGVLSVLDDLRGGGYPDEIERVAAFLEQPENRAALLSSYGEFLSAYQQNSDVLRFHYHRPMELQKRLQELDTPRIEYHSDMAEVPAVGQFITEDEITELIASGSNVQDGKIRIYAYFQGEHTQKEQISFLKDEYGTGGRSHAISGATGSGESHDSKGIVLEKKDCYDVQLSWSKVVGRITALIREDRYLNEAEKATFSDIERESGTDGVPTPHPRSAFPKPEKSAPEQSAPKQPEQPESEGKAPSFMDDYNAVKEAHPDDIVLYQMGDFFEMFGEDARTAAQELDLTLTTRPIGGGMRVDMCGVPGHRLEYYTEHLRDKFDVTVSAIDKNSGQRGVYSLPSVDHEAERDIDEQEAEYGADGTRVFRDTEAEQYQPTLREQFEQYKPTVIAAVTEDTAYRNACGHSDRENAVIEGNAAVRRAILNSGDIQLIKLYSDVPEFRHRLHQQVIDETYPRLHELLRPLSQDDIDDALRAWNGNIGSKRAVVRYMEQHSRDKDTAAWLSREYGGAEDKNLFIVRAGSPETVELPWAKVQRRIAQLIKADKFYTEEEYDRMDDVDPIAIREGLESGESSRFVEQVMADVERIAAQEAAEQQERAASTMDVPGGFVYGGFHFEPVGILGENFDANYTMRHTISKNELGMSTYEGGKRPYTHADFYAAASDKQADVFRCLETGKLYLPGTNELFEYTGTFKPYQEKPQEVVQDTPKDEAKPVAEEHRDPSAPAYKVGDTVYLDNKPFEIESIRAFNVQLRDPSLSIPIFRAESKANFERLLQQDERNSSITDYLPANLTAVDRDLRDVLIRDGGLLSQAEQETIASWFRAGDSNTQIAHRLSEMTTGRAETMELETGELADYFSSVNGVRINILDNENNTKTSLAFMWSDIAPVLRAEYQEHPLNIEAPAPVTPQAESPATPSVRTDTTAVYPAEENHLPYDVVVERLHFDEPEQAPAVEPEPELEVPRNDSGVSVPIGGEWTAFPSVASAEQAAYQEHKDEVRRSAQNFHITDDFLGEGGPKAKYQANINAIKLLKYLEAEKMQASPEQQEVLSRYVGWGSLSDAFDESKPNWAAEYQELKEVLTPEEYAAARASTLNAHYTSPAVIKAIYEAVGNMGFEGGNILEPSMGVGNFFGLLPDNMAGSKLYGVELDSITGRIAQQLYPKADITVAGFETTDRKDFFDIAVGNHSGVKGQNRKKPDFMRVSGFRSPFIIPAAA